MTLFKDLTTIDILIILLYREKTNLQLNYFISYFKRFKASIQF